MIADENSCVYVSFLKDVARHMKRLGVNQTELARRMNVSRPYITNLLKREENISFQTALRLADALQLEFRPSLCAKRHKQSVDVCSNECRNIA